ncbi:unnamed protein product [Protopolystoma xenopodis]|uniref:Uncharacterized protein n=1 Tax=Protopolystoma xenopodis TaxID=117903 RepID=A0A3S5A905_9PLAT|nr:unnamed protein product [Protopolystoma xenopodis]
MFFSPPNLYGKCYGRILLRVVWGEAERLRAVCMRNPLAMGKARFLRSVEQERRNYVVLFCSPLRQSRPSLRDSHSAPASSPPRFKQHKAPEDVRPSIVLPPPLTSYTHTHTVKYIYSYTHIQTQIYILTQDTATRRQTSKEERPQSNGRLLDRRKSHATSQTGRGEEDIGTAETPLRPTPDSAWARICAT